MHLTEGRNTRFKKILDALGATGSSKLEFETDEDRSYFITRLFMHEGFAKQENGAKEPLKTDAVSDNEIKNETSFETKGLQKAGTDY